MSDKLKTFYESHKHELYVYALSLVRNREVAEDVVHNVMLKLVKKLRLPSDLRPYAYRSIRNAAIDELRRKQPGEDYILSLDEVNEDNRNLQEHLQQCLLMLPDNQREVVELKHFQDLTLREIAEVCGKSHNTVGTWYRRGLEALKKIWQGDSL